MTSLLKAAGTVIIVAAAIALLWRYMVVPYQCNLRVRQATHDILLLYDMAPGNLHAAELARRTIVEMSRCTTKCPENIGAQMALAASYRALGLNRQAAAAYQAAVRYDRRPELYLNLGQTQLAMGESKEALQNLVLACIYNPVYLDEISVYHPEVKNAVDAYQTRLLQQTR